MCPQCGEFLFSVLGWLGKLVWFRCQLCGMDSSLPADSFLADELDEIREALFDTTLKGE